MTQFLAIGLGEILWDVLPDARTLGGAAGENLHVFGAEGHERGHVPFGVNPKPGDLSMSRLKLE